MTVHEQDLDVSGRSVGDRQLTIISGGQTGVDRAAPDAALEVGVPCGGWCPAGRKAEDGPIASRYPLRELPGAGYIQRTRKNVEDSDGTLIVIFGAASGGTLRTIEFCQQLGKPHFIVNALAIDYERAAKAVLSFIREYAVVRLNVAGPRASGEPKAYTYTVNLVTDIVAATASS
jgi:putative molybdenum carrier protein